jgi:REP element-mobilizing transposase RayT
MRELPKRKPNRLAGYDYSQNGAYFITACVKDRREILWEPVGARIARPQDEFAAPVLSQNGQIVQQAICSIPKIYDCVSLDRYVVMPNHIHILLLINHDEHIVEGDGRAMRAPTISTVVNQMKGYATKQIGFSIWQKLFHDHIIRNEKEYLQIAEYIENNPQKWEDDCFYVGKSDGTSVGASVEACIARPLPNEIRGA